MVTQYMAAFPASTLKNEVSNAHFRQDDVSAALDLLFHGF
ncbi:CcdB family protein [Oxalobacter formigenes]